MTRYGYDKVNDGYYIILIGSGGNMYQNPDKNFSANFRPVFYLSNDIELFGEGTLESPFKIQSINE